MIDSRRLIVNADDFGFTHDVNAGIIEAHCHGILTSTTLMATGRAFEDAVRLAEQHPGLDVGCHLVLVGGASLRGHKLPESIPELLAALVRRRIQVMAEFESQLERLLTAGLRPTHLDTHKHTHLLPQVLEAVTQLGARYGIPWVRLPFDLPQSGHSGRRLLMALASRLKARYRRALERRGCRAVDHFTGFRLTGVLDTKAMALLIRHLPVGTTELMCHPGRCGAELQSAQTRLKQSRETELAALKSVEVRRALQEAGIQLTTYKAL